MPDTTIQPVLSDDTLLDQAYLATVFDFMEKHKIAKITAEFSGENDSGAFSDYLELDHQTLVDYDEISAWRETVDALMNATMTPKVDRYNRDKQLNLTELIIDLGYAIDSKIDHGVDWVNNTGGQGKVEWILDGEGEDGNHYRRGICFTVEGRIISYDTKHFAAVGMVPGDDGSDAE